MRKALKNLPLDELRQIWRQNWGQQPHARIGHTMLQKSLEYKIREQEKPILSREQQTRLEQLIKQYKRNSACFDSDRTLKPGTRLVRMHDGIKHNVLIKTEGFEYQGRTYNSLSKIANEITGKRWNGWVFFGLKKVGAR